MQLPKGMEHICSGVPAFTHQVTSIKHQGMRRVGKLWQTFKVCQAVLDGEQ